MYLLRGPKFRREGGVSGGWAKSPSLSSFFLEGFPYVPYLRGGSGDSKFSQFQIFPKLGTGGGHRISNFSQIQKSQKLPVTKGVSVTKGSFPVKLGKPSKKKIGQTWAFGSTSADPPLPAELGPPYQVHFFSVLDWTTCSNSCINKWVYNKYWFASNVQFYYNVYCSDLFLSMTSRCYGWGYGGMFSHEFIWCFTAYRLI